MIIVIKYLLECHENVECLPSVVSLFFEQATEKSDLKYLITKTIISLRIQE